MLLIFFRLISWSYNRELTVLIRICQNFRQSTAGSLMRGLPLKDYKDLTRLPLSCALDCPNGLLAEYPT